MGLSELDAIAECDAAGLRGREREVWLIVRQHGPTKDAVVAAFLGISEGAVRVARFRAQRKLHWQQQEPHDAHVLAWERHRRWGEVPLAEQDAWEQGADLLAAMRGRTPSQVRSLYPQEGDRDTVYARVVTVDDAARLILAGRRWRGGAVL